MIRQNLVKDAVYWKWQANQAALTDAHPAVKKFYEVWDKLNEEEKAEVQRQIPEKKWEDSRELSPFAEKKELEAWQCSKSPSGGHFWMPTEWYYEPPGVRTKTPTGFKYFKCKYCPVEKVYPITWEAARGKAEWP